MTPKDKQLLFTDLCARLPYGVICKTKKGDGHLNSINQSIFGTEYGININPLKRNYFSDGITEEQDIKPYLRPMSSMTEEEKGEASKLGICYDGAFHNDIYDVGIVMEEAFAAISWLLERHFDINYLIHKGLALKAPEGMYKFI